MTDTNKPDTLRKGAPTERMIAAAATAALRHGVPLPKDYDRNFDVCKAFLDEYLSRPTPKAIEYAQKIAEEQSIELSPSALVSGRELSAWIDANRAQG